MKCPICNMVLLMSEKQGIEIDYCPKCRGVWLDRGELEKIIERSASAENRSGQVNNEENQKFNKPQEYDHDESQGSGYGRKRNFFSELFD
jgi:Zn-finger nucleic acid-binding protein